VEDLLDRKKASRNYISHSSQTYSSSSPHIPQGRPLGITIISFFFIANIIFTTISLLDSLKFPSIPLILIDIVFIILQIIAAQGLWRMERYGFNFTFFYFGVHITYDYLASSILKTTFLQLSKDFLINPGYLYSTRDWRITYPNISKYHNLAYEYFSYYFDTVLLIELYGLLIIGFVICTYLFFKRHRFPW